MEACQYLVIPWTYKLLILIFPLSSMWYTNDSAIICSERLLCGMPKFENCGFVKLPSLSLTHKKRIYINIFSVFKSNLFSHSYEQTHVRLNSFISCLFSFNITSWTFLYCYTFSASVSFKDCYSSMLFIVHHNLFKHSLFVGCLPCFQSLVL